MSNKSIVELLKDVKQNILVKQHDLMDRDDTGWYYLDGYVDALTFALSHLEDDELCDPSPDGDLHES